MAGCSSASDVRSWARIRRLGWPAASRPGRSASGSNSKQRAAPRARLTARGAVSGADVGHGSRAPRHGTTGSRRSSAVDVSVRTATSSGTIESHFWSDKIDDLVAANWPALSCRLRLRLLRLLSEQVPSAIPDRYEKHQCRQVLVWSWKRRKRIEVGAIRRTDEHDGEERKSPAPALLAQSRFGTIHRATVAHSECPGQVS